MRKLVFILFFFAFFILLKEVYAFEVMLEPKNVFCIANQCDEVEVLVNCSNASEVSGRIEKPIVSQLTFTKDNLFRATIPSYIFENAVKPSDYNLNITCKNNSGEFSNSFSFYVSTLEARIESLTQSYLGDEVTTLGVSVKKDGSSLTYDQVNFSVRPLKLKSWYFSPPLYFLVLEVPNTAGSYNLEVLANVSVEGYGKKQIKLEKTIEVKQPLELTVSLDKTEVRPGDKITLTLSALERGEQVLITKDYLSVKIGSTQVENINLYSSGSAFKAEFEAPELPAGEYELEVKFNYKDYSVTQKRNIGYVLQASGKITDLNNQGITTEIKFLKDGQEKKKFITDASGFYSGFIVPGSYDLQITFPQSTLYLYNVSANSFEDPIKYYFFDTDVEGIRVAGLFVFEFKLSYSKVKIVMKYDERKLNNERDLVVYKCSDFNPSNKICNSEWNKQTATIDTIGNTVTLESSSLSAYATGTRKYLILDFALDKTSYGLKEMVKVRGLVKDESGNLISNALVKVSGNFELNLSTYSDSSGIFYFEFFAPKEEGLYNLLIGAEKGSYLPANKSLAFQVTKKREVSLVIPDTIRLVKGENRTITFSVINTGQADVSNLSLSLEGLPEDYFRMQDRIENIETGQKVDVPVSFMIPNDASEATLSLTFKVFSDEVSKEGIIGLTILSENATQTSLALPSASFSLPITSSDITYLSIFALVCVSLAFILKKSKRGVKERERVKNLLSEIKMEIKRRKENPTQAFNSLVERNEKEST
ncbi:MAG: hypothetical protein ACP5O8_01385 [Candidatus Aenigmatarchaeota archaeon]